MPEPTVSVVVPVRDGTRYLGEALESVARQSAPCSEVIVVDDGSIDGSAELAASFEGTKVISQPQSGISAARNRGVAASRGAMITFIDSDDLWEPRKNELQLAAFAADDSVDLVRSTVEQFLSPELGPGDAPVAVPEGPGAMLTLGAIMLRRALWERVGPFDETVRMGETLDWVLRARRLGMAERITEELVLRRRIHASNTSYQRRAELGEYARVLKRNLDARRSSNDPPRDAG